MSCDGTRPPTTTRSSIRSPSLVANFTAGAIEVSYDGALVLTGSVFTTGTESIQW